MEDISAIIVCLVTALVGTLALPKATDSFLKWKYTKMDQRWFRCLELYLGDEGSAPSQSRSKALGDWLHNQVLACESGKLSYERVSALAQAGIVEDCSAERALPDMKAEKARFAFKATPARRLACALCAAGLGAALATLHLSVALVALACLIGLTQTMICACDCQARIIPIQLCGVYAALAIAWVIVARSTGSIPQSLVLGIAAACFVAAMEAIAVRMTGKSAIGDGDRRLIPLIAFQVGLPGLMPGLLALCAVALAMAVWALAHGRSKRSYLPFAPPLYAWMALGTLWPLAL